MGDVSFGIYGWKLYTDLTFVTMSIITDYIGAIGDTILFIR